MTWKFWQKHRHGPTEGADAKKKSERDLEETLGKWEEVREVQVSMIELRKRNHFQEQFAYLITGTRPDD